MRPPSRFSRRSTAGTTLLAGLVTLWASCATSVRGDDHAFLSFTRAQADALRAGDTPPDSIEAWKERRAAIRQGLIDAWGGFPNEACPLEPRTLGTIDREGYRIEKLVFQTRPGVWMTANAYVPATSGKHPAILMVHGHWRGAKQDPVVQSRCIGAVKLGFFVLVVDALGAGERGVGKALGEYHGGMTGATLLPIGLPLSGLQVYENMRAVDYLRTRPEVDPDRIGITGASGGGNQSMYAGGFDERFKAVAPVCSVGNYRSYLGVACCMCEVVPGALRFTEEWGVLGLTAPRGLLFVNATRDAVQFSVDEAKRSLAPLETLYRAHGRPDHVRQTIFESGHDYSRPMREAVYGWMTLHLKGEGDGSPVAEPDLATEDPESLRCYPGETRPDDYVTIPRFALAEGRKALKDVRRPKDAEEWRNSVAPGRLVNLIDRVLGGFPSVAPVVPKVTRPEGGSVARIDFESEPGVSLTARVELGTRAGRPLAIVLNLEGEDVSLRGPTVAEARKRGWGIVTLDLRGTGRLAWGSDRIAGVPDHNTSEWAMWIGRPMLGQWVFDVRRLLDALGRSKPLGDRPTVVIGEGPAGVVALTVAATDTRVLKSAAVGSLASYLTESPYQGQWLGLMAPGIVRHVGDVADLVALAAPRRVVIAGGVAGDGTPLGPEALRGNYDASARVWTMLGVPESFTVLPDADSAALLRILQ
ncbi:MAG: acetylxylan esterase [Isosphaeraceae bacterium]